MTVVAEVLAAPDRVNNGASAFCHVMCWVYDDQAFCGYIDDSKDWCTRDPCDNECLVCTDLERTMPPCPVCGTDCIPGGGT